MTAKRRRKRPRVKRIGAPRRIGGAFGASKVRGEGEHNLGRGIRKNAYGERFYVYDAGYVLPVPPAPLSPAAAFPLFADWIERECEKATAYLRERTGNPRLLPRVMAGAITIERGRLFQPWIKRERAGSYGELAVDLLLTLQGYKSLEQMDDPDGESQAKKTGVLGWFIRARTQPIRDGGVKRYKPVKRGKVTSKDITDAFGGSLSADSKATRKKATPKRAVRRVGRGSKAKVDQGKRKKGARAGKHRLARGRGIRRKRKR